MKWLNLLHFYQPLSQSKTVLKAIVSQSYRPLLEFVAEGKFEGKFIFNIGGSLLELLDREGYADIIDMFKLALEKEKVELTGSSMFHAFLPLIPSEEVARQVMLNDASLRKFFGAELKLTSFFPPEMAFYRDLPDVIAKFGYKNLMIDEISVEPAGGEFDNKSIPVVASTGTRLFLRNRRVSNLIMSGVTRDVASLKSAIHTDLADKPYIVTAMDAETFGHHRPGLEKFLFEMYRSGDFEFVSTSELDSTLPETPVEPVECTWATSPADIANKSQFLSWNDKNNDIHKMQWELTQLMLACVTGIVDEASLPRLLMDEALGSDHFWWASAKPWWSVEMIEGGAYRILNVIKLAKGESPELTQAYTLYQGIVSTAFEWQRSGKIHALSEEGRDTARIPFIERTLEKGGRDAKIYEAFTEMMRNQEKYCVEKGLYEQAIIWRDALYKIETKNDIYDAIHAVDLLRTYIPNEEVERMLDKYTAGYRNMRGGQPEQRGD